MRRKSKPTGITGVPVKRIGERSGFRNFAAGDLRVICTNHRVDGIMPNDRIVEDLEYANLLRLLLHDTGALS